MRKLNSILLISVLSLSALAQDKSTTENKKEDTVSTKQSATQSASSTSSATTTTSAVLQTGNSAFANRKKYSAYISAVTTTDSKETSDKTKDYDGILSLSLGYQMNPEYRLSLLTSMTKNLAQSFDETLSDTSLTISKSAHQLGMGVLFVPRVSLIVPTSKISKVRDDMNAGFTLGASFSKQLTSKFSLTGSTAATTYSHKYTTNRVDSVNKQYSAGESLFGYYSFTDKLYLGAGVQLGQSWSYRGTRRSDQYGTDLSMNYMPLTTTTLSFGLSTGGQIYKNQRGPDSNIEVYDPNNTSFYLSYGLMI